MITMGMMDTIEKSDPEMHRLLLEELERQENGLEMIPSENDVTKATLQAMGSVLTNKYAEGYAKKRYYGGNEVIDKVELLAIERAKKAFNVPHVNIQPYSGSPANFAVYMALCQPGDTIMGHNLLDGGHLTHGWKSSFSGKIFNSILYNVKEDGYIDIEQIEMLAKKHKPKLIWVGASAYPREFPFREVGRIADEVGAYSVADIAHISGLVITGVHPSPCPFIDIITTTTHKTMRGPRGGIIMVTEKGLKKDPELAKKIDSAVFPGLQGGPHENVIAAIGVALNDTLKPEFREYSRQIVKNCKALAKSLMDSGLKLVSNGTDNHLVLVDLTPFGKGKGYFAEKALDVAHITLNKNTIPKDPSSPFYPSGIRMGTPSLTTRGMKEKEMELIGKLISKIIDEIKDCEIPEDAEERKEYLKEFNDNIKSNMVLLEVRKEVKELCRKFPLYPGFDLLK